MKAINYACLTRSVKKNKNNFINVLENKFGLTIARGKLIILFCKKVL